MWKQNWENEETKEGGKEKWKNAKLQRTKKEGDDPDRNSFGINIRPHRERNRDSIRGEKVG